MTTYLCDNKRQWYKGNLHGHSTRSDGIRSPEELKEIYKESGYSFVALTDHDIYTGLILFK